VGTWGKGEQVGSRGEQGAWGAGGEGRAGSKQAESRGRVENMEQGVGSWGKGRAGSKQAESRGRTVSTYALII
jgi:hypothetical protein